MPWETMEIQGSAEVFSYAEWDSNWWKLDCRDLGDQGNSSVS